MRKQNDIELQVFREFAAVVTLPIIPSTISRRDPPEPDLVCELQGEGPVGFELTELIDAQFMSRLDLMAKTRKGLIEHWQNLPQTDSAKFKIKYGNALLHFRFGRNIKYLKRRATFNALLMELLALPDGFVGEALRLDHRFLPTVEGIVVRRGQFVGPAIDVDSFGWLGDPTKSTVLRKLAKTYVCSYPVELLAYVGWDLLPPEGAWTAAADEAARWWRSAERSELGTGLIVESAPVTSGGKTKPNGIVLGKDCFPSIGRRLFTEPKAVRSTLQTSRRIKVGY